MASWQSLRKKLVEILGSSNVYYNPPEDIRISYPCIIFQLEDIERRSADNIGYIKKHRYQLKLIDYIPDNPARDKLMDLPYCTFDRSYKADNLNHDILEIYW